MSDGWRQSTWGDEISLEYGKAIRGYQDAVAPFRVFGSNGPIGWSEKPLAQGPGVILGRKGAYRGVHFSPDPFFVIDTAYYVKPKSDLDMRWLYYAIIHHKLGEIDDGSPIPSTTRAAVYVRDVEVPPLHEQRAIAATLGALDDKIELNRRMNETLEAMARALFRDWFVEFGPTRAKMAGNAPYLSPDLWSLFPDRLDAEGKPEGWENVPMDSLAEVTMGTSPDGSTYNDTGIGTPLCNGPVEYGDFFLRQIKWTTAPKKLSRRGDLIICVRGSTTGRHAFADAEYCLGRGVASIRGYENNQEFVETALLMQMDRLLQKTTGSVFPSLATQDIKKFALIDPGHSLRLAFATIARPMRDRIWSNAEESRTLAQTRDLLLPRLMSGELRVADLDKSERETAA